MRSTRLLLAALIFISFAFVINAQIEQEKGCCCNSQTGAAQSDTPYFSGECSGEYPSFILPSETEDKMCIQICSENAVIPPGIPEEEACNYPNYKPAPKSLNAVPVAGKQEVQVSWEVACPAEAHIIQRCTGESCSNFITVGTTSASGTSFLDTDALDFGKDYTYRVTARYTIQGESSPALATMNMGDIECLGQTDNSIFCIGASYYDRYRSYLSSRGYRTTDTRAFKTGFEESVNSVFFDKFNKAWRCNVEAPNKLQQYLQCDAGKRCVSSGTSASCLSVSDCAKTGLGFGIGVSVSECEGTAEKKYCFFDRSSSVVNSCYNCNARMSCYDYRTRGACERNNCGTGNCAWHDTISALGIGVCIDQNKDNCALCSQKGTAGIDNVNAYSEIFDRCTKEKSQALSTSKPCFYDGDTQTSKGCSEITCLDYKSRINCIGNKPSGFEIIVDQNNNPTTSSQDICSIGACQWDDTAGCLKNQNGRQEPDRQTYPDCIIGDKNCEADYFPAETTILPTTVKGKVKYLNILISDKRNATGGKTPIDIFNAAQLKKIEAQALGTLQSLGSYSVKICAGTVASPCTNFKNLNVTLLTINDLVVLNGLNSKLNNIFNLTEGTNLIRFYAVDPSRNYESVKSITITACNKCQGPAGNLSVVNGRLYNNTWYAPSSSVAMKVNFDEGAEIASILFRSKASSISLTINPLSGFAESFTLQAVNVPDGNYSVQLNSKDSNGLLMDFPINQTVMVDTVKPTLIVSPGNNAYYNDSKVNITLNFSERVTNLNVTVDEEIIVDDAFRESYTRDITANFTTRDNKTFKAVINMVDGKKLLRIKAEDFAGNQLIPVDSFFSVAGGGPVITLVKPRFGVTATDVFDWEFRTENPANCRWWFDVDYESGITPGANFEDWNAFILTGEQTHKKNAFSDSLIDAGKDYKFLVWCKDALQRNTKKEFTFMYDNQEPIITAAYADPNPIVETPLTTSLTIGTNNRSFCRYSKITDNFYAMENDFPGFNRSGTTGHSVNVTVTGATSFKIGCINLAGLGPVTSTVQVAIDLSQPLILNFTVHPGSDGNEWYSTKAAFDVALTTNRLAICDYKLNTSRNYVPFSSDRERIPIRAHSTRIDTRAPGTFQILFKCVPKSPIGVNEPVLKMLYVDTTAPSMVFVSDNSTYEQDNDISYFTTQMNVNWLGKDVETGIKSYLYMIEDKASKEVKKVLTPWTEPLTGSFFTLTGFREFNNSRTYIIKVTPVNRVGLEGNPMASDGVKIDITKMPVDCANGLWGGDESDIDCGGKDCLQCDAGKKCRINSDCSSNRCNVTSKNCMDILSSCGDGTKNYNETDIDCGGNQCPKCSNDKTCGKNLDCSSNFCKCNERCSNLPAENDLASCSDCVKNYGETAVDCGGACPKCGIGKPCIDDSECLKTPALNLSCFSNSTAVNKTCQVTPSCFNNIRDQDEVGVDCGGVCNNRCGVGFTCVTDDNCVDNYCNKNMTPNVCDYYANRPSCNDNKQNQDETGIDCGGSKCNKCPIRSKCKNNDDCISNVCDSNAKICIPNMNLACENDKRDGSEIDVDCGGSQCPKCTPGSNCTRADDCITNYCDVATRKCGSMPPLNCTNGRKDGTEVDTDCGDDAKECPFCAIGQKCMNNDQCALKYCDAATQSCAKPPLPHCNNAIVDFGESDLNCGSNETGCALCAEGQNCTMNNQCASGYCNTTANDDGIEVNKCNKLANWQCHNNRRDFAETDIDCGGSNCERCADGKKCNTDINCASGFCNSTKICNAASTRPSCDDGLINQDETGVDCGGSRCKRCDVRSPCLRNSDCSSNLCDIDGKICLLNDNVLCHNNLFNVNNQETDTDCGGNYCPVCENNKYCKKNLDCSSNYCDAGTRKCMNIPPAHCTNGYVDSGEIDTDCGAAGCPGCLPGQRCTENAQCSTNNCNTSTQKCVAPLTPLFSCSDGLQNQDETGIDCGGSICKKCGPRVSCLQDSDCISKECNPLQKICVDNTNPLCTNSLINTNNKETDIDCGGSNCPTCSNSMKCLVSSDCTNNYCKAGTKRCMNQPAQHCLNRAQDSGESDVDCGTADCAGCLLGQKCITHLNCDSGYCNQSNVCLPFAKHCNNGVLDIELDESDIDCGSVLSGCEFCDEGLFCTNNGQCKSGYCNKDENRCRVNPNPMTPCTNGIKDINETDIDCGNGCGGCDIGRKCVSDANCQSNYCILNGTMKVCEDNSKRPSCFDGFKNQDETDIDCGGTRPDCKKCGINQSCNYNRECSTNYCESHICKNVPTCDDGFKNQDETDIDCGGSACKKCGNTKTCVRLSDCNSRVCAGEPKRCIENTNEDCRNTLFDGTSLETDIDCGGNNCPTCDNGKNCTVANDCTSNYCNLLSKKCTARPVPTCANNQFDPPETDVDCGSLIPGCPSCGEGKNCNGNNQCTSNYCDNVYRVCQQIIPHCNNRVTDFGETDVDCGSYGCAFCENGKSCSSNDNCASKYCDTSKGKCEENPMLPCTNGNKDGGETDVDCGGTTCNKCVNSKSCILNTDCQSAYCDPKDHKCKDVPSCNDFIRNQDETGVDCGGSICKKCQLRFPCSKSSDCTSNNCDISQKICIANTELLCSNVLLNLNIHETDVDCGGNKCPKCTNDKLCSLGNDCISNYCDAGSSKCMNPPVSNCKNGVKDANEPDTDCGGPTNGCPYCLTGQHCDSSVQCNTNYCNGVTCAVMPPIPINCQDGVKNQAETDIDCGNQPCPSCDVGRDCISGMNCASGICDSQTHKCIPPPSCYNIFRDQDETGIDCGGSKCMACTLDQNCLIGTDCASGYCNSTGFCNDYLTKPSCFDNKKNQDETGIDCGGSICKKCITEYCLSNNDCVSKSCDASIKTCVPNTVSLCANNAIDSSNQETSVDCGGNNCKTCDISLTCSVNNDCATNYCNMTTRKCAEAPLDHCLNSAQDFGESDIDCGAGCPLCTNGKKCVNNNQCVSKYCDASTQKCAPPPSEKCSNGLKDIGEIDVDCGGGLCNRCSLGKKCISYIDCASNYCDQATTKCAMMPPLPVTCTNQVKDGYETDIDCGGQPCFACGVGMNCTTNNSCFSGICDSASRKCVLPPSCSNGIRDQDEKGIDCGGSMCGKCGIGQSCTTNNDCADNYCNTGVTPSVCYPFANRPSCIDGIKNQDETGVDCGGSRCNKCDIRQQCASDANCASKYCEPSQKICLSIERPNCNNGLLNSNNQETAIDCGGNNCPTCSGNQSCSSNDDCTSNNCDPISKTCASSSAMHCSDSIMNFGEPDRDCNTPDCPFCVTGQVCTTDNQCASNFCNKAINRCSSKPEGQCTNGKIDAGEMDTDCGGNCGLCAIGQNCTSDYHCSSSYCGNSSKKCEMTPAQKCFDGVQNIFETDVDCGGSQCRKCALTKACLVNEDCTSNNCENKICKNYVEPTCEDGKKNQDETDVDCGGKCKKCPDGSTCDANKDCGSMCQRSFGICGSVAPDCNNRKKDSKESGTDCGGESECPRCFIGNSCTTNSDCASNYCNSTSKSCSTNTNAQCLDGNKNGAETGIDCGGNICPKCNVTKSCGVNLDCISNFCDSTSQKCAYGYSLPHCKNGIKDVNETSKDCGGPDCDKCASGLPCLINDDCLSSRCDNSTKKCITPETVSCTDGKKNGNETDNDCGGNCQKKCGLTQTCKTNADCDKNYCQSYVCSIPESCSNGKLDGSECDVDCGGSCTQKCKANKGCCNKDENCEAGLKCEYGSCKAPPTLQPETDSDNDGVPDSRDKCPDTPIGTKVGEDGCVVDTCGDGIPDDWRKKYFGEVNCISDSSPDADPDEDGLTNKEEYDYLDSDNWKLNPTKKDTDGDGYDDGVEIKAKTDPTDANDHPSPGLWWLWLLLLLLLAGGGGVAYYLYDKQQKAKTEQKAVIRPLPPLQKPAIKTPLRPLVIKPYVPKPIVKPGIKPIEKSAIKEAPLPPPPKFEELEKKEEKEKEIFRKLDKLTGKPPREKKPELVKEESGIFERLRKVAWSGMSEAEQKEILIKLKLYEQGKLSKEQIDALFKKLRITAEYFTKHKERLERELKQYTEGKTSKSKKLARGKK